MRLLPSEKGWSLDHEVQQMRRLLLARAIEGFSEHGLLDIAEDGGQGVVARVTEQWRGLVAGHQVAPEFGGPPRRRGRGSSIPADGRTPGGVGSRSSSYSRRRDAMCQRNRR